MSKVNGTHAKEVALHFLDVTEQRYTSAIIGKTTNQAKTLLAAGYTRDEIISVIDYINENTDANMYSLGYVNSAINNVLRKIQEEKLIEKQEELRRKLEEERKSYISKEVNELDESTERNRNKLNKFSIQSRKREESYLNMLKE